MNNPHDEYDFGKVVKESEYSEDLKLMIEKNRSDNKDVGEKYFVDIK